jgi:hypothetical protein
MQSPTAAILQTLQTPRLNGGFGIFDEDSYEDELRQCVTQQNELFTEQHCEEIIKVWK